MPCSASFAAKKLVRHLHQNAGAIAGERIATAGAAVRQIDQNFEPLPHNLMALLAMHVNDETHAAGIVLEGRIVQTFCWRGSYGNCDCMATVCSG